VNPEVVGLLSSDVLAFSFGRAVRAFQIFGYDVMAASSRAMALACRALVDPCPDSCTLILHSCSQSGRNSISVSSVPSSIDVECDIIADR